MRTDLRNRPTEKFAFFDTHLMLFVSRTPDAVTDVLIGLREWHNNLVLARRVARSCGRPQSNRLTDFEPVRCHALAHWADTLPVQNAFVDFNLVIFPAML